MKGYEVNFDGIVGPTHQYGGLSYGNVASESHRNTQAFPKEAALQGLKKMADLASKGFKQAVIPPQERPDVWTLREFGFSGSDAEVLAKVKKEMPQLLNLCSSASSMWTANAATISPSADSKDSKVHFTPANLLTNFHRALETATTERILKAIFHNDTHFIHHTPLPSHSLIADEGAANHTRFCSDYQLPGIELFVYGRRCFSQDLTLPKKYPARQTYEASETIARRHQLDFNRVIFAQQNPFVIDQGVFHNDVAAVGNKNVFLYHEEAFLHAPQVLEEISAKFTLCCDAEPIFIKINTSQLSIPEAVSSYLFNSQLLSLPNGSMLLVAPKECEENSRAKECLQAIIQDQKNPIKDVIYFDLRQSMQNGGGPACLRIRVALNEKELASLSPDIFMNDKLYQKLCDWVKRHYRDRLTEEELADPALLEETRVALDELTQLLKLGSIYPFQLR